MCAQEPHRALLGFKICCLQSLYSFSSVSGLEITIGFCLGSSCRGSVERNLTRIHEDADSIPGFFSGFRIWPGNFHMPHATGAVLKSKSKKKKKKKRNLFYFYSILQCFVFQSNLKTYISKFSSGKNELVCVTFR